MSQKKKVRLSDIANKLKISTVTVSKALADKDGVGDELRQQIKEVAEKMGYQVKKTAPVASSSKVTGNIGILIPNKFYSPNVSYYWHIFNILSKELLNRGYYTIMELLTSEDEADLSLPHIVIDKKVDGLIILGQTDDAYLEALKNQFDKFILLDFYSSKLKLDSVSNDDYFCSYIITDYVISQGHKKLKFVGSFGATTSISDRYMGFEKAMLEHGLDCNAKDIIDDRDEMGNMFENNFSLPSAKDMPTAFICNCDEAAARLIDQLEKNGYKVPQDVSVTGFDNYLSRKKPAVGLTTFFVQPEDTTKVAADLIISKITNAPYIKGRHMVSGSLIKRDSVKQL